MVSAFLFTKDGDNVNLDQLRHLNNEIQVLKEHIEHLEKQVVTDVVTGSSPYYPFLERKVYIEGAGTCNKTEKLKLKLRLQLEELMELQTEALDYICSIEDSEMRQILLLRFVSGHPWRKVAQEMGYADESVPRKRCARFLAEYENDRKIRNEVC